MSKGKNKLKIEIFLESMEKLINATDVNTKLLMNEELKSINKEIDKVKKRLSMPIPNTFHAQIWYASQIFKEEPPITFKSFKNNEITKKIFKVENSNETGNFEINIDNAKNLLTKKRIRKKFTWIKPFEIVYKSSISSKDVSNHCYDLCTNSVECLASNFSQDNLNFFCYRLFDELSKLKVEIYSESIITALVFNLIPSKETLFISYDSKISEKIRNKNNFFKCDIAFIIKNSLFVIESKFRSYRKEQSMNALRCISYRAYVPRILNFLEKSKHKSITIENVIQIGVGYQNFPLKVSLSSSFDKRIEFDNYLHSYKREEFMNQMKKRKRGYDYL